MTIDKSRELIKLIISNPPQGVNRDTIDAVRLLLEASIALQKARSGNFEALFFPLPGETIEAPHD